MSRGKRVGGSGLHASDRGGGQKKRGPAKAERLVLRKGGSPTKRKIKGKKGIPGRRHHGRGLRVERRIEKEKKKSQGSFRRKLG